ncbi:glycosyltransferase [Pedobacter sp. 22226]|uniref:glycosyltransferase n=1 Tax=Pedobacter sp. 22226 TaxID=3453894 RepID=UPI003F861924
MVKRLKIGISYNYDEGWIGGTYYIDNLVRALDTLMDVEKPNIVVITAKKTYFDILKQATAYPYLTYQINTGESNLLKKVINTILFRTIGKRIFSRAIENLDGVFPYYKCEQQDQAKIRAYWIADFQEHYLPHFFSESDIFQRKSSQEAIAISNDVLVLSSQNARNHFEEIYPANRAKIYVLPFAVSKHGDLKPLNQLLKKYNLPERFFICCNQFWQHKNHMVILKALNYLNTSGQWNIPIVFTGNTADYRNPAYYLHFLKFIEENGLSHLTFSLGFVDRTDQLTLMKHAIAVIQPSLFEGWSTVIEDAKSFNKIVIASNIDVHKEQLQHTNALFFEVNDMVKLADNIQKTSNQFQPRLFDQNNYANNVKQFAKSFIQIFK